jgi:hypothetical protein
MAVFGKSPWIESMQQIKEHFCRVLAEETLHITMPLS